MSENGIGRNLTQFERNKYFYGKLMTVRDFETEQNFFNEKRHLLNWLIHGIGIVCGLEVEDSNAEEPKRPKKVNGKWNVYLHAGVALDCYGREIVVSRDGFVEVEGTFNDEKLNFLYLRYNECEKESVPVLANVSTCEEVCRDNRVEEVFELELGDSPDEGKVSVSGKVTESDETTSIKGALIEALQNGVVKGITITNESGDYTLMLSPGTYDIRASASGYKSEDKTIPSVPSTNVNFHLPKETAPKDSRDIWVDMPQEYYKEHLKFCPRCEDAKVLLAVVDYNKSGDTETLEIKPEKTYEYRAIVYNNLMLYELISSHIVDFNNPHRMTAEQAGALVSVDGVKNPGGDVDLKPESGSAITITPDDAAKTITIGENHSGRTDNPHKVTAEQVRALKSVNNVGNVNKKYVENINLESEDDTIGITPKVSEDKIDLKVNEIAEKKIKFDTEVGHNHDGINSRLIECYESNLAHVKWINWEHNGDTPINEIGSNETNFIRLEVTFDKDMLSKTINEHTFLVMVRKEEEDYHYYHYDYLRADVIDVGAKEAKFTIYGAERFIDREFKVVLKSDFILDKEVKALDGNFIGGELPSGNGHQGGDFESWFKLTSAVEDTTCISGKLFRSVEGKQPPYPNAPIKVYKSGTENIVAKGSSDKSGNYCIDDIPTSSTVDIIVEEQLIDSKYKCNRAEMTKIDTGTTPGSCSDEKCIEVEDIIAECSLITARTCISGKVVRTYPFTGEEPLPGASVTVTRSGTKEVIAKGSTDASGVYCIDNIPLEIQVDIFVERGEHLYYKAEMKDIDTGTTPGNCIAGNCVEIVKLIAT